MKLRWHEYPVGIKALTVVAVVAWVIFGSLLLTVGYIEIVALSQPSIPNNVYSQPHEIKGIRFFTDRQEQVYSIVKPLMIVAFAITAILFYAVNQTSDRIEREHQKRLIDKIADDTEKSN